MLLDDYDKVPYKVIQFLGAEINYGGRVTDDKDVRLIKTLIKTYICSEVNIKFNNPRPCARTTNSRKAVSTTSRPR